MTGFRVAHGGAQALYGVTPDLTCLGKVIGGGLPVAAYGGRRDLMEWVAPVGPMYQAGTLSGNPLAMAAGIATLRELARPGVYEQLGDTASALVTALRAVAQRARVPLQTAAVGSMWGFFFAENPVYDYATAKESDTARFGRFFHAMLNAGVYIAPSQFETGFVSTAHDSATLDATRAAFEQAFDSIS
jgi:glutamate-1-semialdehyde 2,1-aminomutase